MSQESPGTLPSLASLSLESIRPAPLKLPLVETDLRLPLRIRNAYEDVEEDDSTSVRQGDAAIIVAAMETINNARAMATGPFDIRVYLTQSPNVGLALLRVWHAIIDLGVPFERRTVAIATVLASILVTSPSSLVNYTSAYKRLYSSSYTFDAAQVGAQDSLVQDCLLALAARPVGQQQRRSGMHGHDASFKPVPTPPEERGRWYPGAGSHALSIPVPLTPSNSSTVYTCGDRPEPLPSVGQRLYADDSLVWTHQSRFWSYPCWGKSWSTAAANGSTPNMCTRFVITLNAGVSINCYPMDMSARYEGEVHIVEAPVHLGAYLDSLVLYDENGITVEVTGVRDDIVGETFTSEVHCRLVHRPCDQARLEETRAV